MFAAQGPEVYANVFEKQETPDGDQTFQPETKAEFDSMLRQMQAEGMLGE